MRLKISHVTTRNTYAERTSNHRGGIRGMNHTLSAPFINVDEQKADIIRRDMLPKMGIRKK